MDRFSGSDLILHSLRRSEVFGSALQCNAATQTLAADSIVRDLADTPRSVSLKKVTLFAP